MIYKTCAKAEITNLCCIHVKKDATGQKGTARERVKRGLFLIHLGRVEYLITTLFPKALV